MPTIYYKDSEDTWQPLDIGNIKTGYFVMGSTSYSQNFDEPFAEGYNKPIVVANALGTEDVHVTATSRNGFTVKSNTGSGVMYFAAQGEVVPTFEEANGKQLLDYYLEESKASSNAAQRIASYFNSSFETMSWVDMSRMSEVAAHFPSAFSGYINKTRAVVIEFLSGSIVFRVAGVNHDTNSSDKGAFTFIADKCIIHNYMNASSNTNGGWEKSALRSLLSDTILPSMPADLQAVIAEVSKVNTPGYGTSPTQDKLWIPSQTEVGLGGNEGSAYGIFTSNSSRIRQYRNFNIDWWLRTVENSSDFSSVTDNGSLGIDNAVGALGVVPGFCV